MFTYLDAPEDIGIKCQKEPFDLEFLRDTLRGKQDTSTMQEERLERIPSVKKLVGPADVMPRKEAEYKVRKYCHLWTMYADSSVELKKKSELSQESPVAACKMYVPYISDITRQIEEVVKIFAMEKELRSIKNRGYFPVPQLTPEECKIETIQDKEVLMQEIDEIAVEMVNAIKKSEENYKREQEQARIRDEQLRSARQTSRSDINLYPTLANSTPIRNSNTRSDQPGVHFNTNPFTMFTQLSLMEATSTSHLKMTQYCKEQLPPQWTSLQPMQLMQQVVTNHGDKTTPQTQAQTQSITEQQPDQPVTTDYKMTIHQTPQTPEMDRHASDAENKATWEQNAENKATWEQNAEKEYFATTAEATTTTQKHAGNNITISWAPPTVK